jgi:hypothetical protein
MLQLDPTTMHRIRLRNRVGAALVVFVCLCTSPSLAGAHPAQAGISATAASAGRIGPAKASLHSFPSALATGTTAVSATTPSQSSLNQEEIQQLHQQLEDTRSFINLIMLPMAVLVALLAGGVGIAIWTSFRQETRQSELHGLALAGETAAQGRTEQVHATFLESSQKTLVLVNDTLELAKQAHDRAAEVSRRRATASLVQVDDRAHELIHGALVHQNFKAIVEDPSLRAEVNEVASEILLVEASLLQQDIPLTPACLFVKGMERHLRVITEPNPAIKNLTAAARDAREPEFAALAYYWAGYISNNIGEFVSALDKFGRALDAVDNDEDPLIRVTTDRP